MSTAQDHGEDEDLAPLEEEPRQSLAARAHLHRLLAYLGKRPAAGRVRLGVVLCAGGLASLLAAVFQVSLPLIMREAVDGCMRSSAGPLPLELRIERLQHLGLLYLGALAANLLMGYAGARLLNFVGQHVVASIRLDVWRHLHRLPIRWFDRNPIGRVVTRVANDTGSLAELFTSVLATGVADLVIMLGSLRVLISLDAPLCAQVLVTLPFLLLLGRWFKRESRLRYRRCRALLARINAFLQEHVQGMAVVKAFGAHARVRERFARLNHAHYEAEMRLMHVYGVFRPVVSSGSSVSTAVLLWLGTTRVGTHTMTPGTLLAFFLYIRLLHSPIDELAEKFGVLQSALVAAERIFALLDEEVETYLPGPLQPDYAPTAGVRFENVHFSYDADKPVLRGIDFEVRAGETVALVGPTGSGKSTVLGLMLGLYRLQAHDQGRLEVQGVDIKGWEPGALRSHFGLVQQDLFLFKGTLRHNIALFRPLDEARLHEALRRSRADLMLARLPAGLDTVLGERGYTLSQGERQLVSLARALASDPHIFVLDEATASIDSLTEQSINQSLREVLAGRTAVIIAHRLSTVVHADRILVLKKGRIHEQGTHSELLAAGGLYAQLYRMQQQASPA